MSNAAPVSSRSAPSSSAIQASLDLRVAFGRLRRRMREVAAEDRLSVAQVSVLMRLGKGEAETASALAAIEGVRPQSMATTIASLDELGLIHRHQDPNDGRRQVISLSAAGRATQGHGRALGQEWLADAMHAKLSEEERQTVIAAMALLERLARA